MNIERGTYISCLQFSKSIFEVFKYKNADLKIYPVYVYYLISSMNLSGMNYVYFLHQ